MLDFSEFKKYRENNRIEVKKAAGGLPKSLWSTYSSFANTVGGIILLGVEEKADGSFQTIALDHPERIIQDFWNGVNNRKIVNSNILYESNVTLKEVDGNSIIVIEVPRANRQDRPVYVGENPFTGSFRRNGEGDYHCTHDEVLNMMRDQREISQDMKVLDHLSLKVFDFESLRRYRRRMSTLRPGHVWESVGDIEFLAKLNAVGRGEEDKLHPTGAGLLMFGHENEILKEFPHYFLDYQERMDDETRWTDRIISSSGDWSGNLFDFYFRVYQKISQDLKIPFQLKNGSERVDDTPVHKALREALANALIHANYYERQGLVIIKESRRIKISNPGDMRISVEDAFSGGISDPRNVILIKMFNLIGIGERAGSGLSNIYEVWKNQKWTPPILEENYGPDRTTLILEIKRNGDKETAIKNGDKKTAIKNGDKKESKYEEYKKILIEYFNINESAQISELSELIGLKQSKTREYLKKMVEENILMKDGSNRNRRYLRKK